MLSPLLIHRYRSSPIIISYCLPERLDDNWHTKLVLVGTEKQKQSSEKEETSSTGFPEPRNTRVQKKRKLLAQTFQNLEILSDLVHRHNLLSTSHGPLFPHALGCLGSSFPSSNFFFFFFFWIKTFNSKILSAIWKQNNFFTAIFPVICKKKNPITSIGEREMLSFSQEWVFYLT